MDLNIKKDKRNNGCFFHKNGDVVSNPEIKRQALLDITEDCDKNYVILEATIIKACKSKMIIIPINTTLL